MRSVWLYASIVFFCVAQALFLSGLNAQLPITDSDHDGLSDAVEQALLVQFAPRFIVGQDDCSNLPAEFAEGVKTPTVKRDDGTIYGQVFPAKSSTAETALIEVHFYHLWRRDCGEHGHALDTEHVSVLVQGLKDDSRPTQWKALYWYAAAHEDTVCDVSQIARAVTLDAVDHGARVWISPGKHASYLNETLCRGGCGGDRCEAMVPLEIKRVVNLGEIGHSMNGSTFITSSAWPLQKKMMTTNFAAEPVARLNELPATDIAWFRPGRHPVQGVIAVSASTGTAISTSGGNTGAAIGLAGNSTGDALDKTGNALDKSYRKTRNALGRSAQAVGKALHMTSEPDAKKEE